MFIVLEGLDGAGKSTQIKLLQAYYASQGVPSQYLHFPRFNAPLYGELIAKFLRGELGSINTVDPHLIALIYAGDRHEAAPLISQWIKDGYCVLIDRYVYSNIAYQCAKITNPAKRKELRDWILNMEYTHFGIPKPNLSVFLDVPFSFTEMKLQEERDGDDRNYLKGKADIHEADLQFQKTVGELYREQAQTDPTFKIVNCTGEDSAMLPAEAIFARLKQMLPVIK